MIPTPFLEQNGFLGFVKEKQMLKMYDCTDSLQFVYPTFQNGKGMSNAPLVSLKAGNITGRSWIVFRYCLH